MADFSALKTAIQNYIKQNGNEEITGEILQTILLSIVTTLGDSAIDDLITALNNEVADRQNADSSLEGAINQEGTLRSNADSTLQGNINAEATARQNADAALQAAIDLINSYIPAQASSSNKLADKAFVNSSIATATATFRGSYNVVSDLSLSYNATHTQIQTALATKMSELSITPDNNDYTFVQIPTADATPTQIAKVEKYKYNGTAWAFEYELNNSGFTAAQWAAINSGATLELIGKLSALPTNAELTELLAAKQNVIQDLATIRSGASAGATAVQPATLNAALSNTVIESGVFDLSSYNNGTTYADLNAALTALNALPAAYKKGGMSMKYVQSSDNKYMQYRYMGTAVTGTPNPFLDVFNWQENTEEYINNPKYLYIIKDGSDKLLFAIDFEGNVVFGNGCPKQIKKLIKPVIDFFSETEEDIKERLELTLDQNDNLLSWRDKDGTKHEAVFAAGKFVFSDANKRQLVNALKDINYGNQTDWSDASSIAIPIPRCARINVTNISSMPVAKTTNARAVIQFWDMQGNTFTKTATLNAQGQHSIGDPKKNISIDLHDYNWDGDFSIKFGDWVPQDSFHLKSYWLDWSRVVGPVNYDIIEQVDKSRGILKDRSWKRALMTSSVTASSALDVRMDTGAKCHPMGFPCIVYLNGEFYGIFIWQLKKHRDNYHMEKDNPNHIHVEGLQLSGGSFSWSLNEIRNPKYLVYAEPHSGTYEYDGDVAVAEIAGEKDGTVAGAYSDSTTYTKGALCIFNGRMFMSLADNNTGNTPVACTKPKNVFKNATDYWIDVTFTNTVKQAILRAASYKSEISAAATTEAKKALIEQYYDMDNVIDIALEIAAMRDSDYVINIQSTTWDGVKWYLNAYDKDRSFGISFGTHVNPPSVGSLPGGGAFDYLSLYKERTKDRWLELVDKGIFTLDNIMGTLNDWMQRIGYENYKLENDKWPPQGEYILDTVERLYHFIEKNLEVQNEFMENYV